MTRNALLAVFALLAIATLAGCDLYFGEPYEDDDYVYCDEFGCYECDGDSCTPIGGGGEPGWECANNYDCAAGCYCDDSGYCVEAGFCSSSADCPAGYECDDRASCVPEGSNDACTSDDDCPFGTFCDEQSGYCVDSWTCSEDAECGMGYECDDRGTCVPEPCTSDDECLEGCYCDEEAGNCVETGICTDDSQCGEGMECDTSRNTCEPVDPNNNPSCNADVVCDTLPPQCPAGSAPAIQDGCYTGECIALEDCDVTPPCQYINDEAACLAEDSCSAQYTGINCTDPNGNSCTEGGANCTCESFAFDECVDNAALADSMQ